MEKRFKVGVIGCGSISPTHLSVLKQLEYLELVMVCDIEEDIVKGVAKENDCSYTTDYKVLLSDDAIDVVHILTPHYLHTPMAIEALKANKHVVLEKPVGISFDELCKLNKVAKAYKKTVGVTLQNRYNPTSIKMKELVNSGLYGSVKATKAMVTWKRLGDYYSQSAWRGKLAYEGGGLLINQAIHSVDLLQYVGGKVIKIQGIISNHNHPDIEVEDTALATLHYENGAVGNFYGTTNYGDNSNIEIEIVLEKAKLRLLDHQLYLVQGEHKEIIASDIPRKGEKNYWGKGHFDCISDIYESINENREPLVTLEDGIEATEMVLGIYESSKNLKPYLIS